MCQTEIVPELVQHGLEGITTGGIRFPSGTGGIRLEGRDLKRSQDRQQLIGIKRLKIEPYEVRFRVYTGEVCEAVSSSECGIRDLIVMQGPDLHVRAKR